MPSYDYRCAACNTLFEVRQSIAAPDPGCPVCGASARRVILTAPATHGVASIGREAAVRSLPACGKGCRCCP